MLIEPAYEIPFPHKPVLNALLASIPGYLSKCSLGQYNELYSQIQKKEGGKRHALILSATYAERYDAFSL